MPGSIREIVYLNCDNTIDLILKQRTPPSTEYSAVDLSGTTRMTLAIGNTTIDSALHNGVFDWSEGSGILIIALGGQSLTAGTYRCTLKVYDSVNTNGIRWGDIKIVIQ